MIAPDLKTAIDRLRDLVDAAAVVVPFTGAGISTECGIPDFRSPGGIWTKMRPIEFADFLASQEMRDETWRRRFAMEDQFGGAKPGRGHRALACLYKAGKMPGGDDSKHRQSAPGLWHRCRTRRRVARQHHLRHLPRLRETLRACLGRERFAAAGGTSPDCPACGGHIKTATVSFGQAMPESGDAARPGADRIVRSVSSPSARRWWSGRRRAFPWWPSATARGS